MRCSSQSDPGLKLVKLLSGLSFCLLSLFSGHEASGAAVAWTAGPADIDLTSIATLKVPEGYRYTDAVGARAFLEGTHSPIPKDLTGILAPDSSSSWWVTIEASQTGRIKDDDTSLDAESILAAINAKANASSQAEWEQKPVYHEKTRTIEWATSTEGRTPQEKLIRQAVVMLGRRAVVQASTFAARTPGGSPPLKELVKGITFKPQETYADFQKGDKLARASFSDLVIARAARSPVAGVEATASFKPFWIGLVLVGCAVLVVGVLLVRKLKSHSSAVEPAPAPEPERAPVFRARPALNGAKSKPVANGKRGPARPARDLAMRRRKVFDYSKFYTDMMMQGPTPVIGVEPEYAEDARPNGNHYGNSNGAHSAQDTAALGAQLELINGQKSLIEEQKRLIQEQARLIEEKSKLIAEKNQLLERQSQMIDNNLL